MHNLVGSGVKNEDEGLYPIQHAYWLEQMKAARAKAYGANPATASAQSTPSGAQA